MSDALTNFRKRETALRKKHMRMARGFRTRMNRNGVIEQVPINRSGGFVMGLLFRMVLVVFVFKVMAVTWLGEPRYEDHLSNLSNGAFYEKAGSWILQIDPVTQKLAQFLTPALG